MYFFILGNLDHKVSGNELNNEMLYFLSEIIGRKYKRLARNLDRKDVDIDDMEHNPNYSFMQDKCLNVFQLLLTKKGTVKWNQVKKILESFYQTGIISQFISKYPNFP